MNDDRSFGLAAVEAIRGGLIELCGGYIGDEFAVGEADQAVRVGGGQMQLVQAAHHRDAVRMANAAQQFEYPGADVRVKRSNRFVGDDDVGM